MSNYSQSSKANSKISSVSGLYSSTFRKETIQEEERKREELERRNA